MIGTRRIRHPFAAFVTIALAAVALAATWGCNDIPVSVPAVSSPSFDQLTVARADKSDVATTVGMVDAIDYAAMRLRVGALWFRADTETEIELDDCDARCAFDGIVAGDAVTVKHNRVPDASGAYHAREIEVENEPEDIDHDEAEVEGAVAAVDGSAFEVGGRWFWADAATVFEVDACAAGPLVVGDAVKVEYATDGTTNFGFYAFKVEVDRECEDVEVEVDD